MSRSRLQSLISNIDHMTCLLSSKNSPRNTVDFEAACSVYIRFRGVNSYRTVSNMLVWKTYFGTAPYASRNHVENHLGEQITFFHLDCLCSDVRLNVDFDLTLTVLADLLYRRLAERLKGFGRAGPSRLFRKLVDTPGGIEIRTKEVIVRLSKWAHNPLLKEAGLTAPTQPVPWLGGRSLHLQCP